MKIGNKLGAIAFSALLFASCQSGLVYEEVPESIYNDVNLTSNFCTVQSRHLFENQLYGVNWNKYSEGYISTVTIGNYQGDGKTFTNDTAEPVTILNTTLQPGESITIKNNMDVVDDASAPEGKLYILNIYADKVTLYSSPNKGFLFDGSRLTGDFVLGNTNKNGQFIPTEPQSGMDQQVIMPVNPKEVIVALLLSQEYNCQVTNIDGAPQLGLPGDYSIPRRYLVTNISRRTDGQPAKERLYEVRITFI